MSELTPLNPGGGADHGAARQRRQSRFGPDVQSTGVKPSEKVARKSLAGLQAMAGDAGGARKSASGRRKSRASNAFMEKADGTVSHMSPVEMGRDELYKNIPFVAVPGLQRKEKNLSLAFSSFAAALDVQEADDFLLQSTGKGMGEAEKEKRMSRMSMMMLDELEGEEGTSGATTPLVCAVLIASFLTFNFGYNISVMNPTEPYAFKGHSTSMWSIAVAIFCATGPIGATLGGKWADTKGRKTSIMYGAVLYIVGGLLQTLAPGMITVVLGRAVIGAATGVTMSTVPVYLGELAPPTLRGTIGTMTQFSLVVGIFFADLMAFIFGNDHQWRIMYLFIAVLGACPLFLETYLFESPRWLLEKDPDSEHARFAIKKLRGFRYDEEVEAEVQHYLGASGGSKKDDDGDATKEPANATAELYADKSVRLLLVTSLLFQIVQQLSGINAVFFYSGIFFDGIIENPLVATTLMGGVNVVATILAVVLMDRCGRRTLIMWSCGGMFLSCVLVVLALLGYFGSTMAILAVALYVVFFAIGLGPIPSLIVAEMFDGKYVVPAMTEGTKLNNICNFAVGLFFPYMNEALGAYSFGPFAVVLILGFLYALVYMPETSGTTPAELQAELIKRHEGDTYHNMDIEGSEEGDEWAKALASMAEDEE